MVNYLYIPLVALAAVGVLALVLLWAHTPVKPVAKKPRTPAHGLLVPVATRRTRPEAELLAHELRTSGIKATTAQGSAGVNVLVWPAQLPLAQIRIAQRSVDDG